MITPSSPGVTPAPRRILVVEDDESIAMGLEMNLTAEGYIVAADSFREPIGPSFWERERPGLLGDDES